MNENVNANTCPLLKTISEETEKGLTYYEELVSRLHRSNLIFLSEPETPLNANIKEDNVAIGDFVSSLKKFNEKLLLLNKRLDSEVNKLSKLIG